MIPEETSIGRKVLAVATTTVLAISGSTFAQASEGATSQKPTRAEIFSLKTLMKPILLKPD